MPCITSHKVLSRPALYQLRQWVYTQCLSIKEFQNPSPPDQHPPSVDAAFLVSVAPIDRSAGYVTETPHFSLTTTSTPNKPTIKKGPIPLRDMIDVCSGRVLTYGVQSSRAPAIKGPRSASTTYFPVHAEPLFVMFDGVGAGLPPVYHFSKKNSPKPKSQPWTLNLRCVKPGASVATWDINSYRPPQSTASITS